MKKIMMFLLIGTILSLSVMAQKKPKEDTLARASPPPPVQITVETKIISSRDVDTFIEILQNLPHKQYATYTLESALKELVGWKVQQLQQK